MFYVYILKSLKHPDKIYVGYTSNIDQRIDTHNSGESIYTNKYKPWILLNYTTFSDQIKAVAFEKYLKSGTGKVFIKKHYL